MKKKSLFRLLSKLFLNCYLLWSRIRNKMFSFLISGSFSNYGKNSVIMHPLKISGEDRISIEDKVFIGAGSWLQTLADGDNRTPAIIIGKGVAIVGRITISSVRRVIIENDVLIASNVYISDHMHKYSNINEPIKKQGIDKIDDVLIKSGSWIGQNVVICPGVVIGRGAVVGANSVVNKSIPDYALAVGAPARVVKDNVTKSYPK